MKLIDCDACDDGLVEEYRDYMAIDNSSPDTVSVSCRVCNGKGVIEISDEEYDRILDEEERRREDDY